MIVEFIQAAGGVGIFLLGMYLLTDGLRRLAGDRLRLVLARFTRSAPTGALTGAATTALIQSSSATTVATIGLVGAGLLTFPQALGVIFGANIGTTLTGWIVATLGFKVKLGLIAPLMTLAGVLLRLFARGALAEAGLGLAGFSLLFIGLDMMQAGLAALEGVVTPTVFPEDTVFGRFQLVLIGVAITLVTQSSSAGVATALVALHTGAISFYQAAALVIGMDVGTTFTAVIASLGGSTAMRRTGYAHVTYNVATGLMAFAILPVYVWATAGFLERGGDQQLTLVAFHSLFNLIGVLAILPITGVFARLMVRLVPESGTPLTDRLDDRLLADPPAALDAATGSIQAIALELSGVVAALTSPAGARALPPQRAAELSQALDTVRSYLERVHIDTGRPRLTSRYASAMHALDHLVRLLQRCGQRRRVETLRADRRLARLAGILGHYSARTRDGDWQADARRFDRLRTLMRRQRHVVRDRAIGMAASGAIGTGPTLMRLDAVRWLHRVSYHLWRVSHHMTVAIGQQGDGRAGGS